MLPRRFGGAWYVFRGSSMVLRCLHSATMLPPWCYILWCFRGARIMAPWCLRGAAMVSLWCPPGVSMVLPRCFHDTALDLAWCFHGETVVPWGLVVLPWCFHGASVGPSWKAHLVVRRCCFGGPQKKTRQCSAWSPHFPPVGERDAVTMIARDSS